MIFCSKNEEGIPKWKMISEDIKVNGQTVDVTRRIKPKKVGGNYAVQPNRAKKQVCRIEVLSCMTHFQWCCLLGETLSSEPSETYHSRLLSEFERESNREGVHSYSRLRYYFSSRNINILDTFRINFRKT